MGKSIRLGFLALATVLTIGASSSRGECSKCNAVDCMFDTQCGVFCVCVKLGGKIKGQCVER